MDKWCSTCGSKLTTGEIVTYCPFCKIIKKKPMKTFFIHWKNGLEERLQGTSITNALVVARYDAASINAFDYYTIDDDPIKMKLLTPELTTYKKRKKINISIVVYIDAHGYKQLLEGFYLGQDANDRRDAYRKNNADFMPTGSYYSIEYVDCLMNKEE